MSTVHFVFGTVIALLSTLATVRAEAQEGPIKPFKDELFSQMTVQKSLDGGAYEVIDYQEMRDINGRDREPERRVKDEYVSLGVRRYQQNETLDLSGRRLDVTRVGQADGAAFTVIFIHGRGGDRRLGVNDYTFGGNFNRLKNLTVGNGGIYYSPSVTSFDAQGVADIAALIRYAFDRSSGRPVILACASMGGFICQGISRDEQAVRHLKGMAQLGGPPDPDLAKSRLAKHRLPIYFAHGGSDSVYKSQDQEAVYRKLKAARYPTRFTLFATGSHGTPIRMVDWRKVLNFLLTSP
ncbi:dienelactone hydrolase family protein [Neorhizobium galegae]|uniref:phospholipase n=1 Tax=Neorhizobium galegae TaxID=399 RepID=UPI00062766B9|nr:phospholipase [Neorhizobium galegae]MCQ1765259.1 dienelactone hydrolase family protein [Neorhizobium galegae]MCQ1844172.1 dienelactone hydrolase family protein [Neorhizobium galegae]